jgi:hypothetical protein
MVHMNLHLALRDRRFRQNKLSRCLAIVC